MNIDLSGIVHRKRQWRLDHRRRVRLAWVWFYVGCAVAIGTALAYRLMHNGNWWVL